MSGLLSSVLDRRTLRRWSRAARRAETLDPVRLALLRQRARALSQRVEKVLAIADGRLQLPLAGHAAIRRPMHSDWAWRPDLWTYPISPPGLAAVATKTPFGREAKVFHDERLKSLPLPTAEQTARFADHVADNHSWYKHLPFFPPGATFVFFPNPHAGRGVMADDDRFVVYDIERGDYFAHHSRLPTAEYLAQFGHWDYWVDDNPRVFNHQPGPWLYSADGSHRELLADDLKRQWSCRLTAFLKPAPPMFDATIRVAVGAHVSTEDVPGIGRRRGLFGQITTH